MEDKQEVTVKLGSPEEAAYCEVGATVLHVDRASGAVTLSAAPGGARDERYREAGYAASAEARRKA